MGTRAELDWLLANGMGWLVDSMGGPEAFLSPEPTPTPTSTSQSTSTALPSGPTAEELAKAEADRIAAEQAAEAAYYEEERRRLEAEEAARRAQNAAIEEDERQAEIRRLQETQTTYYQPVQEQEPVYSGTTYYYASNGAAFTSPAERDGYESNLQAIYAAQEAAARAAQETAARAAQEEAAAKAAQEAAANLAAQETAKKAAEEAAAKAAVSNQDTASVSKQISGANMALTSTDTRDITDSATNTTTVVLPSGWESYSPGQKIAWFNTNNISPTQLKAAGVDDGTIAWMQQNGYTVTDATGDAIKAAEEAAAKLAAEAAAKKAADEAAAKKTAEEAAAKLAAEAAAKKAAEEAAAKLAAEAAAKKTAEEAAAKLAAEAAAKKTAEEAAAKLAAEAAAKKAAEEAAAKGTTTGATTTGANLAGLSGLSALANTTQTQTQTQNQGTQQPPPGRVDFSKLPPQLRMAGQYADYLAMPTADKGPKLSTYRKVGDATATGLAGAMPTYTMGRAPTSEEAFRNFIYAGGASDALASERALQYARNMGLTPEQTLSLTNRTLNTNFGLPDYDAAVAAGRGLLAIPEARTAPALSYASPGFTAPSQGGLSAAAAQGMSKGTFYGNINAALQNNLLGPQQVADAMRTYGITADDLIAARAMANTPTTGAATSSTTLPDSATVTERVREGGPIAFAEGDVVKAPVMAGEKAYTLADFGITPATVETARGLGAFTVPRNVLFNPELIKREAAYRKEKGLAGGGDVGRGLGSIAMKGYAQEMAQKGRFGDTMLAHISPEEAQMLQAAGGAGTINPQTGLPEYFSWRNLLKGVGKVLPFVLPFTGIGLGAQALISGLSGAVSGGKGFDFKRGLMSGLMSYGMGSLAQGAGAAANAPTPDITVPQIDTSMNPAFADQAANVIGSGAAPAVNTFKSIADVPLAQMPGQFLENIQAVGQGAMGAATGAPGAREAFTAGQGSVFGKQLTPTMAAGATAVGMGGVKAADEMNQFELQQAMANARTEEERERFRQLFLRTLGPVGFAGGGDIAAMVAGGATGPANEPRTINGAGDGMSDSVPATIEGVQEARLADGEFVIPADVVADLGNGSSNAGSKKLYAMMDRVRKARHGTTRQPPEVDTGRLMPA